MVVLVRRTESDLASVVQDLAAAGAVVNRVGVDRLAVLRGGVLLQRGGENDRLERGSGLVVPAGGVVVEVLQVVLAAVHGDDLARLGVHRRGAGLDVGVDLALLRFQLAGQLGLDRLLQRGLLLLVDVEGDGPAALDHLLCGIRAADALLLHQLVLELLVGELDQIALLAFFTGSALGLLGDRELHALPLGGVQPVLLDHVVQDVVPAVQNQFLERGVGGRDRPVVLARRLEQRGEVGALLDAELPGVGLVVGLGRGLDAVGVAAVVARVDVAREDVVLGFLLVDLQGDDHLLELAGGGLILVQVVVLDVLLSDRRAALGAPAGHGVEQTAGEALQVDAGVTVEALVLRGDEGVLHILGHIGQVHALAVGLADPGEERAVAVLVDVALLLGGGVALGDVHVHVERGETGDAEQAEAEERAEDLLPGEEPAYSALGRLGRLGGPGGRPAAGRRRAAGRVCGAGRLRGTDCLRGTGRGLRTAALGRRAAATALSRSSLFRSSHESLHSASVSGLPSRGQLRKLTPVYMTKGVRSALLRT